MINGFEKETARLTPEERKLLPKVEKILRKCKGPANAKRNSDIRWILNHNSSLNIQSATMRKLINCIRRENTVPLLLANSKGYYVSDEPAKILSYIESLDQRSSAIQAVRRAINKQYNHLIKHPLRATEATGRTMPKRKRARPAAKKASKSKNRKK